MKRKSIFWGIALFTVAALTVTGCKDDDPEEKDETATTLSVDATAYDKWAYVSFTDGKVIEVSDYESDLSWDMALHRYDVRLNGGKAGEGQGAAIETSYSELSEVTTFPTSGYVVDVMDSIMVQMSMPSAIYEYQPVNHEASKWMFFDSSIMPPTSASYNPSNKVYIFKTAEGKHVKIKFLDYSNSEDVKGHIKFSYVFMD
jgi:hypothetical protein